MYLNVCVCNEFLSCQKWQEIKFWTFEAQPARVIKLGLFHPYFVCKCSFRKISMIKTAILDQNKPIWVIFKIKT